MSNPAWEEIAKLYLRYEGKVYRFKVFPKFVGVERQPGGTNRLYEMASEPIADTVYEPNTLVWDYAALARLIDFYEKGA
jgi:hypothetical protein